MLNRQPVAVPDMTRDARVAVEVLRPTFARSLAAAPVGRDEPIGALGVYWSDVHQFRPEDMEFLQTIADATALAMARAGPQPSEALEGRPAAAPAPTGGRSEPPGRRPLRSIVSRIRRGEGLPPNSLEAYALAVVCVLAATLLREGIKASGVPGLVIYSTYYPAAVLAMMVGGRRAGVLAAALGGLAAYWFFMPPMYTFRPLTPTDLLNLTLYGGSCALIILIIDRYQRAVLRLKSADAEHLTVAREQRHRVSNAVSVVEAIVHQSLGDLPARARTINHRVRAGLAGIHIEDGAIDEPMNLRDLLVAELKPFDLAKFNLEGEDHQPVAAKARTILALAIHELATNALKHGALSVPEGRVTIGWRTLGSELTILWREAGGPLVRPPQKRGFGSILLQRLIEGAGGAITMDFRPSGVTAVISLSVAPARRI
jgi:two-component sensor histidine kinase